MLGLLIADVPPARLSGMRTMIHPDHIRGGSCCSNDLCLRNGCLGNRISWLCDEDGKQAYFSEDRDIPKVSGGGLPPPAICMCPPLHALHYNCAKCFLQAQLLLTHHKTSVNGVNPITYPLPLGWMRKALPYLTIGHAYLTQHTKARHLFTSSKGEPYSSGMLWYWFTRLQAKYDVCLGEPGVKAMSPNKLRSVFVTAVQDMHGGMLMQHGNAYMASLPLPADAALCMGNSVKQWDRTYDKHHGARSAKAAVDNMPAFVAAVRSMAT